MESRHNMVKKPFKYAKQLRRILKKYPNMSIKELSEQIDESESFIKSRLALLK